MFEIVCTDVNGQVIEFFTQWDQGQYIYIRDLELTDKKVVVHFANRNSENAFVVNDESDLWIEDGNTIVSKVPNQLLQENLLIYVYVYIYDSDPTIGKTIHIGTIPVHSRPKPDELVFEENINYINVVAMQDFIELLNEHVTVIDERVTAIDDPETGVITALKNADTALQNTVNTEVSRIDKEISVIKNDASNLEKRISGNESAIAILNSDSSVTGSVDQKINSAFNEFASNVTDDGTVNTYKELIDYCAEHAPETANMAADILANTEAINELSEDVENLAEVASVNGIEISSTTPTAERTQVWINPDTTKIITLPEIDDESINSLDTWSSKKINEELTKLSSNTGLGATYELSGSLVDNVQTITLSCSDGTSTYCQFDYYNPEEETITEEEIAALFE